MRHAEFSISVPGADESEAMLNTFHEPGEREGRTAEYIGEVNVRPGLSVYDLSSLFSGLGGCLRETHSVEIGKQSLWLSESIINVS
jgi:hypothetical protein